MDPKKGQSWVLRLRKPTAPPASVTPETSKRLFSVKDLLLAEGSWPAGQQPSLVTMTMLGVRA